MGAPRSQAGPLSSSHELGDEPGGTGGAVGLHRSVIDGAAGGGRWRRRWRRGRWWRSPSAGRPGSDPGGGRRGSSARSGGAAGSTGTAAGSPSAPCRSSDPLRPRGRRRPDAGRAPVRTPGPLPLVPRQAGGSILGPVTTAMRSAGTRRLAFGNASITRRSRCPQTPEPPTVTMQTCSSSRVADSWRSAWRSATSEDSKPVT